MSRRVRIFILIVLVASVTFSTAFILMNSLMDHESSHGTSGVITGIVTDTDDEDEWAHIDLIVRKLAHVIEYAVLGACISALSAFICHFYSKHLFGYAIAYSLFIAVLDEHFQGFSDRVSSTSDILLDFLGSIIGFSFVLIVFFILKYFLNKKKLKNA